MHPAVDNGNGIVSAYDTSKLLALVERQNRQAVIPPVPGRFTQREYDTHACKERHPVECFFTRLDSFSKVVARRLTAQINCAYALWLTFEQLRQRM